MNVENSASGPGGLRALHPQWAHPGSRGGGVATPLRPRSKQAKHHCGFARGKAGGPRGGEVSGPVRGGRDHPGALPELHPHVDRARKGPTVDVDIVLRNLARLRVGCRTESSTRPRSFPLPEPLLSWWVHQDKYKDDILLIRLRGRPFCRERMSAEEKRPS